MPGARVELACLAAIDLKSIVYTIPPPGREKVWTGLAPVYAVLQTAP